MPTFISHSSCLTNKVDLKWWILTVLHSKASVFLPLRLSVLYSKTSSFPKSVCFSYHYASLCFVATPPVWQVNMYVTQCDPVHALATVPRDLDLCPILCMTCYCTLHSITFRNKKNIAQHQTSNRYRREWRWLFHCCFCHLPCCRIWFSCSIINMIMLLVSTDSHHQQTSNTCYCAPKLPHPWLAPFPPRLC